MKIKAVYDFLDFVAPFSTAAEWDNTGLSVGSLNNNVSKVLIALDVTSDVIDEALKEGAELIITHHPLIFDPVKSVESNSLLYKAVKSGITFISSHTCLDKAFGGVNAQLALMLGIKEFKNCGCDEFLYIGEIDCEALSADTFAGIIKNTLGGAVRFNDAGKMIKTVAFCSGAGGEYSSLAYALGADALLTGDASHHHFLEAAEYGISLFAAGHFETENPVTDYLYSLFNEQYSGELEIIKYNSVSPIKTLG